MTKERLRRFLDQQSEINQIGQALEELENRMYSPKAQQLTGMPAAHMDGKDPMAALISRHEELFVMYLTKLDDLLREQCIIETALSKLDQKERQLMRLRYFQGLKWEDICEEMSYSWRQIHRIHGFALKKLSLMD